jgi:hypothetical protein
MHACSLCVGVVFHTAPLECRRAAPVEGHDFPGNVGALGALLFGILGAIRRHSRGT